MRHKELLCIHYYFPPVRSGGVYRNYHFAKAFANHFEYVHVISSDNVKHRQKEVLPIPKNLKVYLSRTLDYRSFRRTSEHKTTSYKSSPVFNFLSKLQKTLPFHFLLGEGSVVYIISSYRRAVRLIKQGRIQMIYSSFMPYADHLIAMMLKIRFPDLIWVADFRDLQVEPLYKNIFFPKINHGLEKLILRKAALITSVSNYFATHLQDLGSTLSVPRGIDLRILEKPTSDEETFTICYTGNLYKDYRDGELVVHAISLLKNLTEKKIRFIHAGRDGFIWQSWFEKHQIPEVFVDKGYLNRQETLELQLRSDVLVLLTTSSLEYQGVFTGKLFEYLETGIPILNVIKGVYDQEFEELFRELNCGQIVYSPKVQDAVGFLQAVIMESKDFEYHIETIESRHSWDHRVRTILEKVDLLTV